MEPADAIAAIARALEAAGVDVLSTSPASGYALRVFSGAQTLPESDITGFEFEDMGNIISRPGQWGFEHWITCPGPGPEDLEHWVATPEELITVTTRFFLGEPCLIEGWVVPLHRHPDWDESCLRRLVAQAQRLAPEEWYRLYEQTIEQYRRLLWERSPYFNTHPRAVGWEEWCACLFVPLEPEEARSGDILWVRRDLEVAYRVSTRCPECGREAVVRTGWRSWGRACASHVCLACDHSLIRPDPRVTAKSAAPASFSVSHQRLPPNRSNSHLT